MARRNRSLEENARREKIRELLQMANIGSMDDPFPKKRTQSRIKKPNKMQR